jgi:hypothetical protein
MAQFHIVESRNGQPLSEDLLLKCFGWRLRRRTEARRRIPARSALGPVIVFKVLILQAPQTTTAYQQACRLRLQTEAPTNSATAFANDPGFQCREAGTGAPAFQRLDPGPAGCTKQ